MYMYIAYICTEFCLKTNVSFFELINQLIFD